MFIIYMFAKLFGEINDLYAYLLGVEVGLDSNARKNRSGEIVQNLVELLLKRKLGNFFCMDN